ncbi:MAG: transposase [Chloroflexi bacterium]|nr:transposase [Chloroflexota bacterium]
MRRWYRPVAQEMLPCAAAHGVVRLIIDSTKAGSHYQLLMVGLAYRKWALPLAWSWVRGKRGHSRAAQQRALLRHVRELLPKGATVLLVGDNEFGSVALLKQLERWGWYYVLRQRGDVKVCVSPATKWQSCKELAPSKGNLFWYPQALLTVEHLHRTRLLAFWQQGEDEPWLLATNLPSAREALQAYRRRVWLDEFFGDMKGHGVNLAKTRLWHFQRLSRLLFIVVMLYLWLVTRGSQTIKKGQRYLVDRRERRDRSIFRIG